MNRGVFIFDGGLGEKEAMQIFYVNVYRVAPPPGGGGYCGSDVIRNRSDGWVCLCGQCLERECDGV